MKLTLALLISSAAALFLFTVSAPPYEFNNMLIRFILSFTVISVLLVLCLLPVLNGRFTQKWTATARLALFISTSAYVLGYLTFSLSTLI